ncbi:Alpha/Beta hydrolase protein [Naematelia encephala]|uniref:Alpha/Beta hydrolase protein n=1 Tax=Naematelia encephala TaxID=71784 RepID=A0A1Y2ATD7_9TREE|nr:Alpha/Beta hydrolase protein [Naematelia encephala]
MAPTQFLHRPDGDIAYDDTLGQGRVVVCVPGMGDLRQSNRILVPLLRDTGYRVITVDLRGHGESSTAFTDFRASAVGGDLVALIDHLDIRNAIVLGNSMAAGSAVWAAAQRPERVAALLLTGPVIRDIPINPIVRTMLNIALWRPWGAVLWEKFYKMLYKSNPPADLDTYAKTLSRNLREHGRLEALQAMMRASKADCEARIGEVRANTLVLMGNLDPDFTDPAQEAQHVAKVLKGRVQMVEGAGHYPHIEYPALVVRALQEIE